MSSFPSPCSEGTAQRRTLALRFGDAPNRPVWCADVSFSILQDGRSLVMVVVEG